MPTYSQEYINAVKEHERQVNDAFIKQKLNGVGPALAFAGGLFSPLFQHAEAINNLSKETDIIDKANKLSPYANLDSTFKKEFINSPDTLGTKIENMFARHIPSSTTEYTPADLTLAGKYKEQLQQLPETNFSTDVITVTPGPNPARFNSSDTSPETLNADRARGYIWGNTAEPQFSYAEGNFNREKVSTINPSIYFTNLDLSSTPKKEFHTTGDVSIDSNLTNKRIWGERSNSDIFFPKEVTRARGEVTAADLYTAIKNKGETPTTVFNPGKKSPGDFLNELAHEYAELNKKPVNESLLELASPVPSLGDAIRERGTIPHSIPFDFSKANSKQLAKVGITFEPNSLFKLGQPDNSYTNLKLQTVPNLNINRNVYDSGLELSPAANSFANIRGKWAPVKSGAAVAGLLYTPEIIDSLEKKQYAKAVTQLGASVASGAASDALIRTGVVQAAKTGITAPARALAAVSPVAGPMALVSQLGGSSRINKKFDEAAANAQMLRAEAARKRGGKWKFPTPFGQVTIPEFGISESGGLFFR